MIYARRIVAVVERMEVVIFLRLILLILLGNDLLEVTSNMFILKRGKISRENRYLCLQDSLSY